MHNVNATRGIEYISGINAKKCMRCGKCSASCPAFAEMDIHPHQVVSMVADGDVAGLESCTTLWHCLSCFACVERCPRDVQPANIIEAVRLWQIRRSGENHMPPDQIPDMLDEELPQQAIVAAIRKYNK